MHIGLEKWKRHTTWDFSTREIINQIWHPFLLRKEFCFAWQMAYQIPATNRWRFCQPARVTLEDKKYPRCTPAIVETLSHCLRECHRVCPVWNWIKTILPATSWDPLTPVHLTMCQALTGEPIIGPTHIPKKWWTALCITTLWHLWLARNFVAWDN